MKLAHKSTITLALILFSTSMIGGQDLSKYRNLSLGTSLAGISKQVDATPNQFTVIHQSPVLIQELTWWPVATSESARRAEVVEQIHFSFCNHDLYKIVVTYEDTATKGLTADDMVQAISATYGTAAQPTADLSAPAPQGFSSADVQIALWENARYSVALSHAPLSDSFQLTLLSKQLNGQAEAGIAEAGRQEIADAPQREAARVKKEADDLAAMRQVNLKSFRP
jgi:hypothetical protein